MKHFAILSLIIGLLCTVACSHQQVSTNGINSDSDDSLCFAGLSNSTWIQVKDSNWPSDGGDTLRLALSSNSATFSTKTTSWTCDCVYRYNDGLMYIYFPCDAKERIKYVVTLCTGESLGVDVYISNKEQSKGGFRKKGKKTFKKVS